MRRMIAMCVVSMSMALSAAAVEDRVSDSRAQPAPATAPSTAPSVQIIRGTVDFEGLLSLQKPNLTRVVVYLASSPALDAMPFGNTPYTVAQHNRAFVPNFLVVPKGANVEFPNWDHFDHNVFSRSAAAPAFDLDRYPYGYSKTKRFEKVGVVQLFCNIHPSMRAIILVTPNSFFTRADASGRFELNGMPSGQYEVVAWSDRTGEQRQTVDLGVNATVDLVFHLNENRKAVLQNDPPNHENDYGVERGLGVKREHLGLPVVQDAHPATQPGPSNP
jgi:plastocyanin